MKRRWTERDEEGREVNDVYILFLLYVEMLLRQCVVDVGGEFLLFAIIIHISR